MMATMATLYQHRRRFIFLPCDALSPHSRSSAATTIGHHSAVAARLQQRSGHPAALARRGARGPRGLAALGRAGPGRARRRELGTESLRVGESGHGLRHSRIKFNRMGLKTHATDSSNVMHRKSWIHILTIMLSLKATSQPLTQCHSVSLRIRCHTQRCCVPTTRARASCQECRRRLLPPPRRRRGRGRGRVLHTLVTGRVLHTLVTAGRALHALVMLVLDFVHALTLEIPGHNAKQHRHHAAHVEGVSRQIAQDLQFTRPTLAVRPTTARPWQGLLRLTRPTTRDDGGLPDHDAWQYQCRGTPCSASFSSPSNHRRRLRSHNFPPGVTQGAHSGGAHRHRPADWLMSMTSSASPQLAGNFDIAPSRVRHSRAVNDCSQIVSPLCRARFAVRDPARKLASLSCNNAQSSGSKYAASFSRGRLLRSTSRRSSLARPSSPLPPRVHWKYRRCRPWYSGSTRGRETAAAATCRQPCCQRWCTESRIGIDRSEPKPMTLRHAELSWAELVHCHRVAEVPQTSLQIREISAVAQARDILEQQMCRFARHPAKDCQQRLEGAAARASASLQNLRFIPESTAQPTQVLATKTHNAQVHLRGYIHFAATDMVCSLPFGEKTHVVQQHCGLVHHADPCLLPRVDLTCQDLGRSKLAIHDS